MKQSTAFDCMNNMLTIVGLLILLLYTYTSCAKYQSPGNGILKRRVIEHKTEDKMGKLLDNLQTHNLAEALDRLQGINTLFAELKVQSVKEAVNSIKSMRSNLNELLTALEVQTADEGIRRAQQVVTVVKQLTQLQANLPQPN